MIAIDLTLGISLFLSIIITLVIVSWFRYTYDKQAKIKTKRKIIQCAYCSHLFYDLEKKEIKICPNCQSYL